MRRIVSLAAVILSAAAVVAIPAAAEKPKSFPTFLQVFDTHTTGSKITRLSGELSSANPRCVRVRRHITISPVLKNHGPTVHFRNFGGSRAGKFSVTLKHAPYWKPGAYFKIVVSPYRLRSGAICRDVRTVTI